MIDYSNLFTLSRIEERGGVRWLAVRLKHCSGGRPSFGCEGGFWMIGYLGWLTVSGEGKGYVVTKYSKIRRSCKKEVDRKAARIAKNNNRSKSRV